MKFSKGLISTLKNFATINTGINLNAGTFIMTRAANGATYGEVNLQPEDAIDFDVAIYDLNAFLSILSLSGEESEVSVKGADIIIKGKRSEIIWPSCDPSAIVYPKKPIQFPPAEVEFELPAEEYNQVMKIARGLGADTLAITNKSGLVVINAFNKTVDANLEKPVSTFEVAEYDGSRDFNFVINLTNLKLQADTYKVQLWAKDHLFAARFEGTSANYVIAVEDESSHNF